MDQSIIQTLLNEDGIPLDEKDVELIWKDMATKAGFYTVHIENVHIPMPDLLMIWKGITIYHEVKMQRGNLIYFQHYQWANLLKMRHSLQPWLLNIVVWKDGIYKLFSVDQIKEAGVDVAGHGKVKASIGLLEPMFVVSNDFEFELYIEWLRSKIWKKKPTAPGAMS
jgi:hypothetical protein